MSAYGVSPASARAPPGDAPVLAWDASTEKVNGGSRSPRAFSGGCSPSMIDLSLPYSDQPNVVVARDVGPVLGEDASAPCVGLGLEDDPHSCALKSKVDPSDAAEEAPDIHACPPVSRSAASPRAVRCNITRRGPSGPDT